MTRFLLIRHAHSVANEAGVLAGRNPGITLSAHGIKQSIEMARTLSGASIDLLFSSPLERCIQTATPIARTLGKRLLTSDAFIEMDYGTWSGRRLSELNREAMWRTIRKNPSKVTFPQGESFLSAERRIFKELNALSRRKPNGTIAIVTHGDIIKMAVNLVLGNDLDRFQRIIIDPASLTSFTWSPKERFTLNINQPLAAKVNAKKRERHRPSVRQSSRRQLGGGSDV